MKKTIIYVLIILLIVTSGTNLLYGLELGYTFPVIAFLYSYFDGKRLYVKEYFFLGLFIVLLLFQNFYFNGSIIPDLLSFFSICSICLIGKLVKKDFKGYFVNIIYFLCFTSLIIWILIQISDPFKSMLMSIAKSLPHFSAYSTFLGGDGEVTSHHAYLYNVNEVRSERNNSIFYEPGRFVIYICFAFIINVFYKQEKLLSRKNVIFILALISTFSTTGYIAFALILGIIILRSKTNILAKLLGVLAFITVIYYVSSLDFMTMKILSQVNDSETYSRFTAFVYHFTFIVKSPFIGFGNYLPPLELSPNGISFLILKYGILFFILYMYLFYYGIKSIVGSASTSSNYIFGIFISMLLLAFSQTITTESFYMVIMFMGLDYVSAKNG